ncbi:MAG TPA: alpha/beta hydrolase [Candidatus Dormibacteraeota bacterium]|nr:alpha/beta hydrolase [Candidatus Dormibacteraeota bacterium]
MTAPPEQKNWSTRPPWLALLGACLVVIAMASSAVLGWIIGPSLLHPANLNPIRISRTAEMLRRTGAIKQDFAVRAPDGTILRGWIIKPPHPNGDWILLFHGISDNRTGTLGPAQFLLGRGYSLVMMDLRAQGQSGGSMVTYGWKEKYDTISITNALYSTENVRRLGALGVSLGAAVALQSAAVDSRIEAVVAEDPFASLREVSYDYAGLHISPLLGETIFRPATIAALYRLGKVGGFSPDDVSPEKAVAARAFPILLICGTRDRTVPCRHARMIYRAARGPKQLWVVNRAGHAAAFGTAPVEYQQRVIRFFEQSFSEPKTRTTGRTIPARFSFQPSAKISTAGRVKAALE